MNGISTVYNINRFKKENSVDDKVNCNNKNIRYISSLEIQVTNTCNLNCTYCFQRNKSASTLMPFQYNRILDILFNDEEDKDNFEKFQITEGKRGYFFLYFIGGEPLLQIKNIRYFIYKFEEKLEFHGMKNLNWKIGFTTNGTLFFTKEVQDFYKEYKDRIWMVTSIDGYSEESNDIYRRYKKNGNGTFKDIKPVLDYFNFHHTDDNKVTMKYVISKANLKYLDSDITKMAKEGYSYVHTGLVEEDDWTLGDAKLYYQKLNNIIEYIIEYNLIDKFDLNTISLNSSTNRFTSNIREMDSIKPCSIFFKEKLTISADGDFIPCMALDKSSSGDYLLMKYGDIKNGEFKTEEQLKIYNYLYFNFKSSDFYSYKCAHCPCVLRCGGCPGISYKYTGNIQMCTNACNMHMVEYLAHTRFYNVAYYYNKNSIKHKNPQDGNLYLPPDECIKLIGYDEYESIISLINGRILLNE